MDQLSVGSLDALFATGSAPVFLREEEVERLRHAVVARTYRTDVPRDEDVDEAVDQQRHEYFGHVHLVICKVSHGLRECSRIRTCESHFRERRPLCLTDVIVKRNHRHSVAESSLRQQQLEHSHAVSVHYHRTYREQ